MNLNDSSYSVIFDNPLIGLALTNLDGCFFECNQKFCDITGYTAQEIIRLQLKDIIHKDDFIDDKSKAISLEKRYMKKDGSLAWAMVSSSLVKDEEGKPTHFVTMIQDMNEPDEFFKRAIEEAPFPIMIHAENGEVLQLNNAWTEISGYTIQDIPTTSIWSEKAYGKRMEIVLKDIDKLYSLAKREVEGEYIIRTKNGKERVWNFSSAPLGRTHDARRLVMSIADDLTKLKKTETELKQSEERFEGLFEKAPLGYQSLDFDGNFLEVNEAWLEMLGYTKEELIGKWFGDFLAPEFVEAFRARFPIFKAAGKIHSEFNLVHKSGQFKTIAFDGRVGYLENGDFAQTHCILKDITEQKVVEDNLRESEARYHAIFDHSALGICNTALDGKFLDANQMFCDILGYSLEELKSYQYADISHPDDIEKSRAVMKKLVNQEVDNVYFEKRYIKKDKSIVNVMITASVVKDNQGAPLYTVTTIQDITQQKVAEEDLRQAQMFLKAAFDNSQAGMAIATAPDGKLLYVNKAGLLIRDKSAEEIMENIAIDQYVSSWNILHLDGTPYKPEEVPLAKAVLFGETSNEEFIIRRDNFEDRVVLANAAPIKNENGNVMAGIVVFLDITERKAVEEELKITANFLQESQKVGHVGSYQLDFTNGSWKSSEELDRILGIEDNYDYSIEGWISTVHPEGQKRMREYLDELRTNRKGFDFEYKILRAIDQQERWVHGYGKPEFDNQGNLTAIIGTVRDITEDMKKSEQLIHYSYHDSLTGLYNRRYFEEKLIELDTESDLPLSIMICDINGLKLINDIYGHQEGDKLIQLTAEKLKRLLRENDILARWGGDEMIILLPKTSSSEVEALYEKMDNQLYNENTLQASISVGYATKSNPLHNIYQTIKIVEDFMYKRKLFERKSLRSSIVSSILTTLNEKDIETFEHGERMKALARETGKEIGLSESMISDLELTALLHDIGKIAIDDAIIKKPSKLSTTECNEIKRHCEIGYHITQATSEFQHIALYILSHHEKIDGSGYPQKLAGDAIPLISRVISVIDAYDAMTQHRPYRNTMTCDEAVKELVACAGTHFDEKIVDVFVNKVLKNV